MTDYIKKLLVIMVLICSSQALFAQEGDILEALGNVKDKAHSHIEGIKVELFSNTDNAVLSSVKTKKDGHFNFSLDLNKEYVLTLTKPGYIKKKILINTLVKGTDENYFEYKYNVIMSDKIEEELDLYADKPTVRVYYDPRLKDFTYDSLYTNSLRRDLKNLPQAKKDEMRELLESAAASAGGNTAPRVVVDDGPKKAQEEKDRLDSIARAKAAQEEQAKNAALAAAAKAEADRLAKLKADEDAKRKLLEADASEKAKLDSQAKLAEEKRRKQELADLEAQKEAQRKKDAELKAAQKEREKIAADTKPKPAKVEEEKEKVEVKPKKQKEEFDMNKMEQASKEKGVDMKTMVDDDATANLIANRMNNANSVILIKKALKDQKTKSNNLYTKYETGNPLTSLLDVVDAYERNPINK